MNVSCDNCVFLDEGGCQAPIPYVLIASVPQALEGGVAIAPANREAYALCCDMYNENPVDGGARLDAQATS